MPPTREYLGILQVVVKCVVGDGSPPRPQTPEEIAAWLRGLQLKDVEEAMRLGGTDGPQPLVILRSVIDCILEETHDPRIADWTPEQMVFWFGQVRARDIEQVLRDQETHGRGHDQAAE